MTERNAVQRLAYVYGWRLRYLWLDTNAGRWLCLGLAGVLLVAGGVMLGLGLMRPAAQQQAAFWVQIVIMVVSALVMMALAPKPKKPEAGTPEVPEVEDGQGIRMVFGEVWVSDLTVIGHKPMGTKNIRGKKSGFSGRPIIGYWYKQLFHFLVSRGPVDAVLEFRGGDKTAWRGQVTANTTLQIRGKDLWGGEKTGGEGGIEGPLALRFGRADQQPSAYLANNLGPQQSAHRGRLTAVFEGGLWGAFSPYPKTASIKVRRILEGWEGAGCWYPERAVVGMVPPSSASIYFAIDLSGSMDQITSNGRTRLQNMQSALTVVMSELRGAVSRGMNLDLMCVGYGVHPSTRVSIVRRKCTAADVDAVAEWVNSRSAIYNHTAFTAGVLDAVEFFSGAVSVWRGGFLITDGEPNSDPAGTLTPLQVAQEAGAVVRSLVGVPWYGVNIDLADTQFTQYVHTGGGAVPVVGGENLTALAAIIAGTIYSGQSGMNPAHILYQSITDSWMGDEPVEDIDEASFTAAADRLYAEGFGLCTQWVPGEESVQQFQQRICDVIGASLARSPITGRWYLDLIRDDYVLANLPILGDDDIIEYQEQPATLDEAVNQVIVEWFDPVAKEDRSTAPIQSLGGIQRAGGVVAEVSTYREIPSESLALRVGARDRQTKGQPQSRFELKTTRVAWAWRPGQRFRLQCPRRGIADMVCRVGDIDRGTLRSGAISLTAIQDVFALPDVAYVQPEPGDGGQPSAEPQPPAAARIEELPYALLASLMPPGELAALSPDDAYLFAVASPAGSELGYTLHVDAGDGYTEADDADWCATALTVTDYGPADAVIAISHLRHDDEVGTGAMVLWGPEICRLDAIDRVAGTVTLGRGCADTVPAVHAAGTRLWILTDAIALDPTRYTSPATVQAKLPTRTGSSEQDVASGLQLSLALLGRAGLPYPPGRCAVDAHLYPEEPVAVTGDFVLSWAMRSRVSQAAVLVDALGVSIAPDYMTRTGICVRDDTNTVVVERDDIAGTGATIRLPDAGGYVVEIYALNENGRSLQGVRLPVEVSAGSSVAAPVIEADTWSGTPEAIVDAGGDD